MATLEGSSVTTSVSFEGQVVRLQITIPICPQCKANFASDLDAAGQPVLCRQCRSLAQVARKGLEGVS